MVPPIVGGHWALTPLLRDSPGQAGGLGPPNRLGPRLNLSRNNSYEVRRAYHRRTVGRGSVEPGAGARRRDGLDTRRARVARPGMGLPRPRDAASVPVPAARLARRV